MFQSIIDFFNTFLSILYNALSWLLNALLEIIPFCFLLIFDGFFTVISAFVSAINVGNLAVQAAASWGLLPQSVAYIVCNIGIPTGLSMLSTAWLIRFLLNLIPAAFTRV